MLRAVTNGKVCSHLSSNAVQINSFCVVASDGLGTQNQIFMGTQNHLARNEEKPCSTCLKPIALWHFQNPNPQFRVPYPSLMVNIQLNKETASTGSSTTPSLIILPFFPIL